MTENLKNNPQLLDRFVQSDSLATPLEDLNTIAAAVGFLILRYTAKPNIRFSFSYQGQIFIKEWQIDETNRLKDLKDTFYSTNDEADASRELSVWTPLVLECTKEEEIEECLRQAHTKGIEPDIIFHITPGPKRSCTVFSSIQNHTFEYLTQIQHHWLHGIRLFRTHANSIIQKLTILSGEEYEQMVYTWNANEKPHEKGEFEFEAFDKRVEETPDKIAILSDKGSLSYRELQIRANRLAHYLQKHGIKPEVVAGIYLARSIEFVVALLALTKSGGSFLPLDPDHPKDRNEYFIKDSRVPFIITNLQWRSSLPEGEYKTIVLEDIEDEVSLLPHHSPAHGLKPGNMSFLFYTSGSTGQPKGVMMETDYKLKKEEEDLIDTPVKTEKVLLKSSTGFTLILIETFQPLVTGGQIVVVPRDKDKDSEWLVDTIQSNGVEDLKAVPSMLSFLLGQEGIQNCTSLRSVYTVGERLPVSVQREFFKKLPHARLYVYYGCTEAPSATFREIKPDEDYGERVVLGKPMANKKIYLLDDFGVPVPVGVPGEIFVGGGISRGYIHNDTLTKERFLPDPFSRKEGDRMYRTGDLGRYLKDGSIEYLGRTDFQVQIRGIRIEPGEIEGVLYQYPAVRDCVVTSQQDHREETQLVAYLVFKPSDSNQRNDLPGRTTALRNWAKGKLPLYMIPAVFVQLEELPLTPNGKVDRKSLPDPRKQSANLKVDSGEPQTDLQETLCQLWREVLNVEKVGIHDNFFALGGNSLLVMQLINRVALKLEKTIKVRAVFEAPTVGELSKLISS